MRICVKRMRVLAQVTIRNATYQALLETRKWASAKQLIPRVEELTQRTGLTHQNLAYGLNRLETCGKVESVRPVKRRGKEYRAK